MEAMTSGRLCLLTLTVMVISTRNTKCRQVNVDHFSLYHVDTGPSVLMNITYIIRELDWKSVVVFYDDTKAGEFQQLMVDLTDETEDQQISSLIYDMTTTPYHSFDNTLKEIHHLCTGDINAITLCDEENTIQILSTANTIDETSSRLLDYRHRSHWLVVTTGTAADAIKRTVTNLDNVAIQPLIEDDATRKRFCENNVFPVFPSCNPACEDRYIVVASGMPTDKTWVLYSYETTQRSTVSLRTLLYPNTVYGYNRLELLVTTRKSGPCSQTSTSNNTTVYSGYCFDIFRDTITALNFSYRVIESDNREWGHREEGGNFSGMMGELQRGVADIAVVDLTFHENRGTVADFVLPGLGVLNEVVLYRKSMDRELSLVSFLDPFQSSVYLVLASILLVVPGLYYGVERILVDDKLSVQELYCYFVGSIFQHSGSINPVSWSARTVVATFWLGSMCLAVFYTAYLTASLTAGKAIQPFNNLRELIEREDYKVGTKGQGPSFKMLKTSKAGLMRDLYLKIAESNRTDPTVIDSELERVLNKVLTEKFALILSDDLARQAMTTDCRFAVLKDVVQTQQVSFGMRKQSPFRNNIEKMLARVVENGISQYSEEKAEKLILTCGHLRGREVGMEYMLGKVSVLVIGLTLATLILVMEHIVRFTTRRKMK